jgi:putative transposase
MRSFGKLSHAVWHCQYHIVWTPKYRFKVLTGPVAQELHNYVRIYGGRLGCEVVELNVPIDYVHLLIEVSPKVSISALMGTLKGKSTLRIFSKFPYLKQRPYWGNHFWSKGYCVESVGLDAEMVSKYVKYQDQQDMKKPH